MIALELLSSKLMEMTDCNGVDGDDEANGGGEVNASSASGGVVVFGGGIIELTDVLISVDFIVDFVILALALQGHYFLSVASCN